MNRIIKPLIATGITITLLGFPALVSAHEGESHSGRSGSDSSRTTAPDDKSMQSVSPSPSMEKSEIETESEHTQDRQSLASVITDDKKSEIRQKQDDRKKKICDNREKTINTIMHNMDNRRQRAYDHITKVYNAVTAFYADKNLSVANYGELIQKVDSAQAVASTTMKTQQSSSQFDCEGEHPKSDISEFKTNRLNSIAAMQKYRQAVKDLIQAIKPATKETES